MRRLDPTDEGLPPDHRLSAMDAPASPEQRFLAYTRDRDPSVLDELLQEHADRAYALAYRTVGRHDLADDAVQEAFLQLIATADRYRPEIPFASWLGRLVLSAAIAQLRRGSRHRRVAVDSVAAQPPAERDDAPLQAMRAALSGMAERYRVPLALYYFAGLDQADVARTLGLSPGTIATRLSRGLRQLREHMRRRGFSTSDAALGAICAGLPDVAAGPALRSSLHQIAAQHGSTLVVKPASGLLAGTMTKVACGLIATMAAIAGLAVATRPSPAAPTPIASVMPTAGSATTSAAAALIATMAPNSWRRAPGTRLRATLVDTERFPGIHLVTGPVAVVRSWSGAALDTRRGRLVLWGGGPADYAGNELYAFSLQTLAWERLTDPSPHPAPEGDVNADGTPTPRQTYNSLAYIAHADRFFAQGDCPARAGSVPGGTWTFDFAGARWSDRAPAIRPPCGPGADCAYDPATRLLWFGSTGHSAGLWSYDYDRNAWQRHDERDFYEQTTAIDTRRHQLVAVGNGLVFSYDLSQRDAVRSEWTGAEGDAIVATRGPGLDYDPVGDRFVAWAGGAVRLLDPATHAWTSCDAPGAPTPTPNGIFGRWRYVPDLRVFMVVTDVDEDVFFYKPPG